MEQRKVVNILRLLIEFGFLAYGVLYKGWSPMFILFGLWLEGFARILFTNLLVLVSRGSGKLKFIGVHTFVSLVFQFVHLIFFMVVAGAALNAGQDSFLLNFFALFFGHDSPETDPLVKLYMEKNQLVLPEIFIKDVLFLCSAIVFAYIVPTISEIFQLRKNNEEWKKARLSVTASIKAHILLIAFCVLIFIDEKVNLLGFILIGVSFLVDIMMTGRGTYKTIEEFMQKKKKFRYKEKVNNNLPIIKN